MDAIFVRCPNCETHTLLHSGDEERCFVCLGWHFRRITLSGQQVIEMRPAPDAPAVPAPSKAARIAQLEMRVQTLGTDLAALTQRLEEAERALANSWRVTFTRKDTP